MAHFVIGWLRNTSYYLFGSGSSGLGTSNEFPFFPATEHEFGSIVGRICSGCRCPAHHCPGPLGSHYGHCTPAWVDHGPNRARCPSGWHGARNTTLILAAIVWLAGVAVAARFGHWVDRISSVALVGFGLWIAISSWLDLRSGDRHGHSHGPHGHTHDFSHLAKPGSAANVIHGPELQRMFGEHGVLELSIYESRQPPRFRFTATRPQTVQTVTVETRREDGPRQLFTFLRRGDYWESLDDIPEPHGFAVNVTVSHDGHEHAYQTAFAEH
jgi:hypothetical protein